MNKINLLKIIFLMIFLQNENGKNINLKLPKLNNNLFLLYFIFPILIRSIIFYIEVSNRISTDLILLEIYCYK